jgi:hypothetical protein
MVMGGTNLKKLMIVHKLLQQCSSLELVSAFLKARNLTHSAGSWKDMLEKRLQPAIENRQLRLEDLVRFLEESEGHGKQHVFLYRAKSDAQVALLKNTRLDAILDEKGWRKLVNSPLVLELPKDPTVGSISMVKSGDGSVESLSIKVVETRETQHFVGDTIKGNFLTKRYEIVKERAVRIARLHRSGLLELRIGSRSNTTKYKEDIHSFWALINGIISRESFAELHLRVAKDKLATQPVELSGIVKYSQSVMRDPTGATMKLATGQPDSDLTNSPAARAGSFAFSQNDGSCESSNIWFVARDGLPLARDVHILLSGETNEFAITQHCTKDDYEYVLGQILSLNG